MCTNDFGVPHDVRVVRIVSTGTWWAAVLAHNPFWKEKICETFGSRLFKSLARLFVLNPQVQKMVDDIKLKFKAVPSVVSLQIRRYEGAGVTNAQEEVFFRCAELLSNQHTKWFLATDRPRTREFLEEQLGDKLIVTQSNDSSTFFNKVTVSGVQTAVAEIWLLGEANEIIYSAHSTFGDVAHARTGLVPHIVTKDKECVKLLTSEPCFHEWKSVVSIPCWKDEWYSVDMLNNDNCIY